MEDPSLLTASSRRNSQGRLSSFWQFLRHHKRRRAVAADRTALDAALMQATLEGNLPCVCDLLRQGANRHVQHPHDSDDTAFDTPLEAAAWLGHTDIVRCFLQPVPRSASARRLLKRNSRKSMERSKSETVSSSSSSREVRMDHAAFLVACHGGNLETIQCFVETFGDGLVTQPYAHNVGPLHHACARCDLPIMQYLIAHGARLDGRHNTGGGTPPVQWLGMYAEMKHLHENGQDEQTSPIPLPSNVSMAAYEVALAWIIQNHRASLFVTDNRGVAVLQRLLHRATTGLMRTAVVELLTPRIIPPRIK